MTGTALTIDQVAEKLKVSDRTVRNMIKDKRIRAFKVGQRRWRIDQDDLDAYIEAQKQAAQTM